MPSGYAMYRLGHSSVRDQRVLDKLAPVGDDPSAVLPRALDAVVALAKAQGIELEVPDVQPPPGGMTQPVSDFKKRQSAASAQVGSSARSTRAATGGAGGGAGAWLFALPVGLLVLAAAALIGRSRRRERAS
jgi:hypothetical protein